MAGRLFNRPDNASGTSARAFGSLGAMIIAVAALLAMALAQTAPARAVENRLSDYRRSMHDAHVPYSESVVIVAIDDRTLSALPYASPIDRSLLAAVLAELDKRNPRAVGFDILFDRPSDPAADQALASAIASADATVIAVADPGAARLEACRTFSVATPPNDPRPSGIIEPIAAVARPGHGVQCLDGVDDVMRRASFRSAAGLPSFAVALADAGGDAPPAPTSSRPSLPINLSTDGGWPFVTISAANIAQVPDAWIAGKYVLIGQITPYSGDWRATPLRFATLNPQVEPAAEMPPGRMPGVVMHAYALDALLTGKRGPDTGWLTLLIASLMGAAIGAAIGSAARVPWWAKLLGVLATVGIGWWTVFAAFAWTGALLPYTPTALGLVLAAGSSLALKERDERARRQSIHNAFQHFLAPQVVDELVRTPDLLTLTAEDREVSALFTDLAGFTRMIDDLAPNVAADVLNGYLDIIIQEVMAHGGAVDKIVGDAVHALFSAPIADPDHRLHAARCALAIQSGTEVYRAQLRARGLELGETRIGLNAGIATVGNFGASRRLDYTAHGSTINLAARLESANKTLGTRICVHETSRIDGEGLTFRTIGPALIRGLVDPVLLFELRAADASRKDLIGAYETAISHIGPGDAEAALLDLQHRDPHDGLVAFQLSRIRAGTWGEVISL